MLDDQPFASAMIISNADGSSKILESQSVALDTLQKSGDAASAVSVVGSYGCDHLVLAQLLLVCDYIAKASCEGVMRRTNRWRHQ